jgi:hypothetical protein
MLARGGELREPLPGGGDSDFTNVLVISRIAGITEQLTYAVHSLSCEEVVNKHFRG